MLDLVLVFRSNFYVEFLGTEALILLSEDGHKIIEGDDVCQVARFINGRTSVGEIVACLSTTVGGDRTISAINYLIGQGHVTPVDHITPKGVNALFDRLGMTTIQAKAILDQRPLGILTLASPEVHSQARSSLLSIGLMLAEDGSHISTAWGLVCIVRDYLDPRISDIASLCREQSKPLLIAKLTGSRAWIGPALNSTRGPCWHCTERRVRSNREVENLLERQGRKGPFPLDHCRHPALEPAHFSMFAGQVLLFALEQLPSTVFNSILIADVLTMAQSTHEIAPYADCRWCSQHPHAETNTVWQGFNNTAPEDLLTRPGEDRIEPPDMVITRYIKHVSPVTGIVSQLLPSPWNKKSPIRVYTAGHNFALKNDSIFFLKDGLRSNSSGKGRTAEAAKASALCEALERYSGVYQGSESFISAAYNEVASEAIHPNEIMLFSQQQYTQRELWNARGSRFQIIPRQLDPSTKIEWCEVESLLGECPRLAPAACCYYGYPTSNDVFYAWADSNGAAAGTTIEDATLQACYELIERDAVALWWYNRIARPRIDVKSFNDNYLDNCISFYTSIGRDFWALDLTTDFGIPVIVALSRSLNGSAEDIMMGFGSHSDASKALVRAVTELNQFLPAVLERNSDGTTSYAYDDIDAKKWWSEATVDNQQWLSHPKGTSQQERKKLDYEDLGSLSILDQLDRQLEAIKTSGLHVYRLNQTRPDIGLPVVKLFAPGMRHFWARYDSGRLYEVPVQLGWLPAAQPESCLNPYPMFL